RARTRAGGTAKGNGPTGAVPRGRLRAAQGRKVDVDPSRDPRPPARLLPGDEGDGSGQPSALPQPDFPRARRRPGPGRLDGLGVALRVPPPAGAVDGARPDRRAGRISVPVRRESGLTVD